MSSDNSRPLIMFSSLTFYAIRSNTYIIHVQNILKAITISHTTKTRNDSKRDLKNLDIFVIQKQCLTNINYSCPASNYTMILSDGIAKVFKYICIFWIQYFLLISLHAECPLPVELVVEFYRFSARYEIFYRTIGDYVD